MERVHSSEEFASDILARLEYSEKFAAVLLESANDSIFVLDEKGVILSVNRQAEKLLGYSKNAMEGSAYQSLLLEEDLELAARDLWKVYQGERIHTMVRLKTLDGKIVFVEFSGTIVDLGAQKVLLGIGRDLTERVRAEKDRALLASIVEASVDAIYGTDMEGRINVWNPAAEQLYGYGSGEIIGENVLTLVPAERLAESQRLLEECRMGKAVVHFETIRKNRRQEMIPVSLTLSPLRDENGRVVGVSVVARDLTQERKAEESFRKSEEFLRQAQKMEAIGQLAAGVAHDFNNLLSVISGHSEYLICELADNDSLRIEAEEIKKTVRRGADLTRQLLVFGRRDVSQPMPLKLDRILKDLGQMLQRMVGEDLELTLKADKDLKIIMADANQVQQVLLNLCSNSRDAMPQGGSLAIEAKNISHKGAHLTATGEIFPGDYVQLTVRDTGSGIAPEALEHIFEPFFTTKEAGKGTGLGLANVYNIVKKFDGHLWVESEKNKGTAFHILFPVYESVGEQVVKAEQKPTTLTGTETILLVEDEEPLRKILCRHLSKQGYRILAASDGQEGLTLAAQQGGKIDLLLTDTVMPKMSGKQLADILRDACAHTRVLFMSGYPREVLAQQGVLEAHIHLIQKPFSAEDLFIKIREVLGEKLPVR